ncbi:MAG: MATE family efflux transporter [Peptoniphilaceae bacterium]|nr:MATE family efflux transporter [Peptoniphilaceae bacterium]MDD7434427.1 MATE family efflux transporter [Peptoniphilaceae bacterium]MDY3075629.1 MATE family efflux transporter [Peptoniphilaceae bacterium]MDY5842284.1 MATE family efflux transporter [Peptoniphilaceae bacterium]
MYAKEKGYIDLTNCKIIKGLILFSLPMIAGNLLQQFYNITDTLIVGKFIGRDALAAVGSAYSLMTFLTSVFLGLSMGAGVLFSIELGRENLHRLRSAVSHAFVLILLITAVLNVLLFLGTDPLLHFLSIPDEIYDYTKEYLLIIFTGLIAISLYNFFACLLRAVGNSVVPLVYLGISALLNIGLDLLFVPVFQWGIQGAAIATVIAQYVSGIGILVYFLAKGHRFIPEPEERKFDAGVLKDILSLSSMTCIQQSCMNFGILLVQRLVDSFGTVTMAAFAAGVKIDTFAYLPVQDFGNAFSIFISQNCGAGKSDRQRKGFRIATLISLAFSALASILVVAFARPLMQIFISANETEVLASGIRYLHIEGAFYIGIGCLFLLYGFYRGIGRPGISVMLTIVSLGTRVILAYILAPIIGETGIWMAVPIGWLLADVIGYGWYFFKKSSWFQ